MVGGARPLFFLDYVASARLEPATIAALVGGVAAACRAHAIPLLGGETAEMPGVYEAGAFDLVGTIIGVAERDAVLTGERVQAGDVVFGLASGGLQTNGFSLARKVLGGSLHEAFGASTVGAALLAPHRSFFGAVWPLLEAGLVRACAHITGGGLLENLPRALPAGLGAHLTPTWPVPEIFTLIQKRGGVGAAEMYRVFNMGVGFALITAPQDAAAVRARLPEAFVIGEVVPGSGVRIEGVAES